MDHSHKKENCSYEGCDQNFSIDENDYLNDIVKKRFGKCIVCNKYACLNYSTFYYQVELSTLQQYPHIYELNHDYSIISKFGSPTKNTKYICFQCLSHIVKDHLKIKC